MGWRVSSLDDGAACAHFPAGAGNGFQDACLDIRVSGIKLEMPRGGKGACALGRCTVRFEDFPAGWEALGVPQGRFVYWLS